MVAGSGGGCDYRALPTSGEAATPHAPAGGGGQGGGGRTDNRPQAAQGGGRTAGRRGAGPRRRTRAGRARQRPARAKEARPAGPRRFGAPRTQQNNPVLLSEGGRNARTQQNLCFGVFVRQLPPPNFGGGALRSEFPKKVPKNGYGGRQPWGGTTTPPLGRDL